MPWPLSDDIDTAISRLSPPTQPARHWWWTWPVQLLLILAIGVGFVAATKPDPIPVHKDGSIRATKVQP